MTDFGLVGLVFPFLSRIRDRSLKQLFSSCFFSFEASKALGIEYTFLVRVRVA